MKVIKIVTTFRSKYMNLITSQTLIWHFAFCSAAQAAIKEEKEAEEAVAKEIKAAEDEAEAMVDAAKTALKDATDKLAAIADAASAELADFAQASYKSLLAGWEEAKKTFSENKK